MKTIQCKKKQAKKRGRRSREAKQLASANLETTKRNSEQRLETAAGIELKSLILAQDERWRRA